MGIARFILITLVALIFITTISCTGSSKAPAQSGTASEIVPLAKAIGSQTGSGNTKGEKWDQVLANAKKEGKVNVWAVAGLWNPARAPLVEAFKKKHGVDVDTVIATSQLLNERLFRERKAGIFDVDIILASGAGALELKKADVLDQIEPALLLPEVTDPGAWMGGGIYWVDTERTQFLFGGGVGPYILINTSMVKPEEIKSMHDLLNPKWKGKIVMYDPTTPGPGRTQFMVLVSNELEIWPKSGMV